MVSKVYASNVWEIHVSAPLVLSGIPIFCSWIDVNVTSLCLWLWLWYRQGRSAYGVWGVSSVQDAFSCLSPAFLVGCLPFFYWFRGVLSIVLILSSVSFIYCKCLVTADGLLSILLMMFVDEVKLTVLDIIWHCRLRCHDWSILLYSKEKICFSFKAFRVLFFTLSLNLSGYICIKVQDHHVW